MKEFEIAIIGTGNLGRAIAHGFASQIPKEKIVLTRRHASKLEHLANLGFSTTDDNVAAAKNSNIIVLCVQPKQVEGVLKEIDAIIDPTRTNPTNLKVPGNRILLLGDIGATENTDGADAWKNSSGNDTLVANENDIIEWSGTDWQIVFDSSTKTDPATDITYTTNLTTGIQYKWDGEEWTLSFEGEYRKGSWRLVL